MRTEIFRTVTIALFLIAFAFIVGCGNEEIDGEVVKDATPETELAEHGEEDRLYDGHGQGEGVHAEEEGELHGNAGYTAEEINAMDLSGISIDSTMTLNEISEAGYIKVWHIIADFNLPENVDLDKTIDELNQEEDINLNIDEIRDYIINFEHGKGHHEPVE